MDAPTLFNFTLPDVRWAVARSVHTMNWVETDSRLIGVLFLTHDRCIPGFVKCQEKEPCYGNFTSPRDSPRLVELRDCQRLVSISSCIGWGQVVSFQALFQFHRVVSEDEANTMRVGTVTIYSLVNGLNAWYSVELKLSFLSWWFTTSSLPFQQ